MALKTKKPSLMKWFIILFFSIGIGLKVMDLFRGNDTPNVKETSKVDLSVDKWFGTECDEAILENTEQKPILEKCKHIIVELAKAKYDSKVISNIFTKRAETLIVQRFSIAYNKGEYIEASRYANAYIKVLESVPGGLKGLKRAEILAKAATSYYWAGAYEKANKLHLQIIPIYRNKASKIILMRELIEYGANLAFLGHLEKSASAYEEALSVISTLSKSNKDFVLSKRDRLVLHSGSLLDLSTIYTRLGWFARAKETIVKAQNITEKVFPDDPVAGAYEQSSLAEVLFYQGNFAQALEVVDETLQNIIERKKTSFKMPSAAIANLRVRKATILDALGLHKDVMEQINIVLDKCTITGSLDALTNNKRIVFNKKGVELGIFFFGKDNIIVPTRYCPIGESINALSLQARIFQTLGEPQKAMDAISKQIVLAGFKKQLILPEDKVADFLLSFAISESVRIMSIPQKNVIAWDFKDIEKNIPLNSFTYSHYAEIVGDSLFLTKQYKSARDLYSKALRSKKLHHSSNHPALLRLASKRARSSLAISPGQAALTEVNAVLKRQRNILRVDHPEIGLSLIALGEGLVATARFEEALSAANEAQSILGPLLQSSHQSRRQIVKTKIQSLVALGHISEADELRKSDNAVAKEKNKVAAMFGKIAQMTDIFGGAIDTLSRYGKYYEAAELLDTGLQSMTLIGQNGSFYQNISLIDKLLDGSQRLLEWDVQEEKVREYLKRVETHIKGHDQDVPHLLARFNFLNNLAAFRRTASQQEVEKMRAALNNTADILGKEHPDTIELKINMASVLIITKKFEEAAVILDGVIKSASKYVTDQYWDRTGISKFERLIKRASDLQVQLAWNWSHGSFPSPRMGIETAFIAIQRARFESVAATFGSAALRGRAKNQQEYEVIDKWLRRQQKISELQRKAFVDQFVTPSHSLDRNQRRSNLTEKLEVLNLQQKKEGSALLKIIKTTNSKEVSIAEVTDSLRSGEAFVTFHMSESHIYTFVITSTNQYWVRNDYKKVKFPGPFNKVHGRFRLFMAIGRAIAELNPTLSKKIQSLDAKSATSLDLSTNRDLHTLFNLLLGRAYSHIQGIDHLIIAPPSFLHFVPFSALRIRNTGDGQAAWLVEKHSHAILPTAWNLVESRRRQQILGIQKPYLGFGNPYLSGPTRFDILSKNIKQTWGMFSDLLRNGVGAVENIDKLPRLPETESEIKEASTILGGSSDDIFLGHRATEQTVKKLALNNYRILHFATHGITAGDSNGMGQPALVLTPPNRATLLDDGLLTAAEVSNLKLAADLVILSACDTASGSDPRAEALVGLVKAFINAGAKSVLATLWPVYSDGAKEVVVRTLKETVRLPKEGAAKALQRAVISLIKSKNEQLSSPVTWSGFVLYGEGGRETGK